MKTVLNGTEIKEIKI